MSLGWEGESSKGGGYSKRAQHASLGRAYVKRLVGLDAKVAK